MHRLNLDAACNSVLLFHHFHCGSLLVNNNKETTGAFKLMLYDKDRLLRGHSKQINKAHRWHPNLFGLHNHHYCANKMKEKVLDSQAQWITVLIYSVLECLASDICLIIVESFLFKRAKIFLLCGDVISLVQPCGKFRIILINNKQKFVIKFLRM